MFATLLAAQPSLPECHPGLPDLPLLTVKAQRKWLYLSSSSQHGLQVHHFPTGNGKEYLPKLYNKSIQWTGKNDMKEVIGATDILGMNGMDQRLASYRVLIRDIVDIPLQFMWIVSPPVKGLANLSRDIRNKWKGQTPEPTGAEQAAFEHAVRVRQEFCKTALLANQLDDERGQPQESHQSCWKKPATV